MCQGDSSNEEANLVAADVKNILGAQPFVSSVQMGTTRYSEISHDGRPRSRLFEAFIVEKPLTLLWWTYTGT